MEFVWIFMMVPVAALVVTAVARLLGPRSGRAPDLLAGVCVAMLVLNAMVAGAFHLAVVAAISVATAAALFAVAVRRH